MGERAAEGEGGQLPSSSSALVARQAPEPYRLRLFISITLPETGWLGMPAPSVPSSDLRPIPEATAT